MKGADMITPVRTLKVGVLCERKDDLLVSDADIREIARNVRNKAIDEFVNLVNECSGYTPNCIEHDLSLTVYTIHEIAEQLKGGVK